MPYWLVIIFLLVLNASSVQAEYKQQQQRERDKDERVSAQGTRGCPFKQGELYLESSSDQYLVVNPVFPKIVLHIVSPDSTKAQQTVKISLVDLESQETKFIKEYQIVGSSKLLITPDINLERPHILTAGLICNPQRPSTTKSLRILLVVDEK